MRIEVLGPSGVGKSTILKKVERFWKERLVFPNDLESLMKSESFTDHAILQKNYFHDNNHINTYLGSTFSCIAKSILSVGGKFVAINLVKNSLVHHTVLHTIYTNNKIFIHDELLLHRGLSFLHLCDDFESEARQYYELVPVPDVAIICTSPANIILQRIAERECKRNCYLDSIGPALKMLVVKAVAVCAIAGKILQKRGVDVHFVDTSGCVDAAADRFNEIIHEKVMQVALTDGHMSYEEGLKERSLITSKSFRKKEGRHYPKTPNVLYCAFSTPNFTVERKEAQRDASTRFEQFGLNESTLRGKTVLDLGSNIGAMLFQATNFHIAQGLGIEFDFDKVKIAQEIAKLSKLEVLSFRQGDIDALVANELGTFDITFAFAVERHIINPERLYTLLGALTKEALYFEGNPRCDVEYVQNRLYEAGFTTVTFLGYCTDDIVPSNNTRPLLKAVKGKAVR